VPTTRTAIYPGSFDPLTLGHLNLIERGLNTFDRLVVAIVSNPNKTPLFSVEERAQMIREATGNDDRIQVDSFEGLLVDYVATMKTNVVLRGLRAVQDFEYEFEMAMMNRRLMPKLEIVFLMTDDAFFYISSSMVREVAKLGGDVKGFVPPQVYKHLQARFGGKKLKKEKAR
jgi:pantetheine-phosphate adenylyltransferase